MLPAIGLVVNPFILLQDLVDTLRLKIDSRVIYFISFVDIVLAVFCCIVAWQFFRKKRNTPTLAIGLYLTSLILTLLCGLIIIICHVFSDFKIVKYIQVPLMVSVIWIPYFLLSDRVKRTFVRD